MHRCLEEIAGLHGEDERVTSEVVISGVDEREGDEIPDEDDPTSSVKAYWKSKLTKYGTEERYLEDVISRFNSSEDPDLLIVVDKLITGFDAPRNTVLYLTRRLENHTLLQAVARVNRLYAGKDFGFILDYVGILGELDRALADYAALANFDADDLVATLTNVRSEVENLPDVYGDLLDIF